jgi:polyphosphate glucokinase
MEVLLQKVRFPGGLLSSLTCAPVPGPLIPPFPWQRVRYESEAEADLPGNISKTEEMSVHPDKEGTNMAEMATKKATPKTAAPATAAPATAAPATAAPKAAAPRTAAPKKAAARAAAPKAAPPKQNILVIDVGGTNLKLIDSNHAEPVKIPSGTTMTAQKMVAEVKNATQGWGYTVVSIGYPGPVRQGKLIAEPHNLGPGWIEMDFEKEFGCPVRVVNDAAMQALGSYDGGRMLFLGLGTGLGSALIIDGVLAPMELAHLPYRKGKTFEEFVGIRGFEKLGKAKWLENVNTVIHLLRNALVADYVVLGGGNSKKLKELPEGVHLGANSNAFLGGFRLWTEYKK